VHEISTRIYDECDNAGNYKGKRDGIKVVARIYEIAVSDDECDCEGQYIGI
jgi:hypothetical protein